MGKYVLAYRGGAMEESPEAQEAVMGKWMGWFSEIGGAVSDMGNPFGSSTVVGSNTSSGLTGYTIVAADSLDAAATLAKGCPVLEAGGSVEVYEALEM